MTTKNCSDCGAAIPTKEPAPQNLRPDLCAKCRRRLARAVWASEHPDKDKESKRAWARRNIAAVAVTKTRWRKANMDRWNKTGKAWKKAHPEAMRVYQLRKYGLTPEDYRRMFVAQDGRCAICEQPPKSGRRLCVDHDHGTTQNRALLCVKCNAGLGNFCDNPGLLLAAERYLQQHRRKKVAA